MRSLDLEEGRKRGITQGNSISTRRIFVRCVVSMLFLISKFFSECSCHIIQCIIAEVIDAASR